MADWDKRFMDMTLHTAEWSKDRSTKVAAIIVKGDTPVAIGYNGFPRGMNDDIESRHTRPAKYKYTEHAERNAIYNAAREGGKVGGSRIYIPFFPCVDCARAIIQSGIIEVISIKPDLNHERWGEDFKISLEMFNEVGIIVKYYTSS